MMHRTVPLIVAAGCFLLSLVVPACKKDSSPVDAGKAESAKFSFAVAVKNSAGTPVSGLCVSIYSKTPQPSMKKGSPAEPLPSATSVFFAIEQTSNVEFAVREMDGTIVSCPVNSMLQAGTYSVLLSLPIGGSGTKVYRGILTATSTVTGGVLFRDSIYMTLWRDDPSTSIVGATNAEGVWQTGDSLMFPGILVLPLLIKTEVTGPDSTGVFSIPKEVVITLADTVHHQEQSFHRTLTSGENRFTLTWTVSSLTMRKKMPEEPQSISSVIREPSPPPAIAWRLRQNYPNPFR
ncbi:MAG: hypothetical protein NTV54_09385 [Ignavibacteriales bacterium]|nr:hypothetical protein [Ignavibacteriales bacterium]